MPLQVQLPGYLKSLPVPKSVGGFYELTRNEWLQLLPFFIFLITFVYIILSPFISFLTNVRKPRPRINSKQKLSEPKVADTVDIEDLGNKTVYCRCWRSNKVQCEKQVQNLRAISMNLPTEVVSNKNVKWKQSSVFLLLKPLCTASLSS